MRQALASVRRWRYAGCEGFASHREEYRMHEIQVATRQRTQFVNITREVAEGARQLGVANGVLTVFVPHTTAGITIND
jgi:thiamine phosphate synthase YjbQ (UPF0047 family)